MAALTAEQRDALRVRFESDQSAVWATIAVGQADIRAALDALDDYFTAQAATINDQLPEPAKSGLSVAQKAWLVKNIIDLKYGA